MIGKSALFARNALQQFVRHGSHGGVPGENLPFQLKNRYRLTAVMIFYFASGFGAPFFILKHQLTKK